MTAIDKSPKTLMQAVRHFANLDVCHAYMAKIKWPDEVVKCPKCGSENIGIIASRRMFQCKVKTCRKQFSVKVGTIFEDSPLGLDKWFVAVWSITNAKNGISSCELARAIGVTQKSAWHMLHRVRLAMQTNSFNKFTGEVESDETFIGGKAHNMHASRRKEKIRGTGGVGKAIVHGLLQRGGKVRASVAKDARRKTLIPAVIEAVEPGSRVYTDALKSYIGLSEQYVHEVIDHAECYVRDKVHTNGMENFWSLLKRTIGGTYVSVDVPHLSRYLDEQTFRFNERKLDDAGRFNTVMPNVVGRRLTYSALIGHNTAEGLASTDEAEASGLTN
jgi:transposase-like protein